MYACPNCQRRLVGVRHPQGVFWTCEACGGRAVTVPVLRRTHVRDYVNQVWAYARDEKGVRRRPCPACNLKMLDVPIVHGGTAHWLDVCTRCYFVWFDPREYEQAPALPASSTPEASDAELSPKAREALAVETARRIGQGPSGIEEGPPDEWWELLPAFLGLPVEEGNPVQRRPWLTWSLVGLISLVSVAAFFNLDRVVDAFGLKPSEALRYGGLTLITSFFLHAGVFHLLGNMYFLWVFGDNTEDCLGRRRYALLLLLADMAGNLLHILGDPRSSVPCIGASGGISGVIAFYALQFPHARLGLYWRFVFYFRRILMPAWFAFLLWMALQIVMACMQVSGYSSVSALAHLGGATAGFVLWWMWRKV